MRTVRIIGMILLCNWWYLQAQAPSESMEQFIAEIFEQFTAENEIVLDFESFLDDLLDCAQNPINLNNTSREELRKLPFLSDLQIENIQYYVYLRGPLKSLYELQLIEGLDMTDIRRMLPFVRIGTGIDERNKIYPRELLTKSKNELLIRMDKGLETKKTYQSASPSYLGNSWYHSFKYRYHFRNKVLAGITGEKDAGEPLWNAHPKGFDYYSAYAQVNNIGNLKTAIIGDYRVGFGQGLVIQSGFNPGKSASVLQVSPTSSGLKKYSSTDEVHFFRGVGTTLQYENQELTTFFSRRGIDADTLNHSFSSILSTGYHRNTDEIRNKHSVTEIDFGLDYTYRFPLMHIGFTAVHSSLSQTLNPSQEIYNRLNFRGNNQSVAGLHYRFKIKNLYFSGETASESHGKIATINICHFNPISRLSMVVVQRYYSPAYHALHASAFAENSEPQNESGIYIGTEIHPVKNWKVSAYTDSYRFSWPRYLVDAPSIGSDYLLQTDYSARKDLNMYWRVKYKVQEQNLSSTESPLPIVLTYKKMSVRYQLNYLIGAFKFKTVLESKLVKTSPYSEVTYGAIALQDISYQFQSIPLKFDFRYLMFDAVEYNNRMYAYENDILYAYSLPVFYGLGNRIYFNLRYEPNRHLSCWFKLAQTTYSDERESIGNGDDEIAGNRKTDFRFLIKWVF